MAGCGGLPSKERAGARDHGPAVGASGMEAIMGATDGAARVPIRPVVLPRGRFAAGRSPRPAVLLR
ncbi:hypothetical protein [Arthrobacter sp. NPDC058127]|uniref:hypothetical protein n=1 Tax=Arthrobacter sp. NPDC058127 TaxID=3346351 RepID=UPI0036EB2DD8